MAARAITRSEVQPANASTLDSSNLFSVKVPVLSEQSTSIDAASSTAERRVGNTPRLVRARAPIAVERVNVAGKATGTVASSTINASGMNSAAGNPLQYEYAIRARATAPFTIARFVTTLKMAFCCVLTT